MILSLTLRSLYLFREFWWRDRASQELDSDTKEANDEARETVRSELVKLFERWEHFPEEAAEWRITYSYGEPDVHRRGAFPSWFPRGVDSTMETMISTKR